MVVTRIWCAELQSLQREEEGVVEVQERSCSQKSAFVAISRQVDMENPLPDTQGMSQTFGRSKFASPLSYDGVSLGHYRIIALIFWFKRISIQADAENYFKYFELHAWDGKLFWGMETDPRFSRLWHDIIDFDCVYLTYHGSADARKFLRVADVSREIFSFDFGPLVQEDVEVYLFLYNYYI